MDMHPELPGEREPPLYFAALHHGAQRRAVYYNKRLAAGNSHAPMLALSSALQAVNATSMAYDEAKAVLESAGFDGQRLDTAIERGAVVHDDDNVSFGIPSFHSHMAALRNALVAEPGRLALNGDEVPGGPHLRCLNTRPAQIEGSTFNLCRLWLCLAA